MTDEQIEDLRAFVRLQVAIGFAGPAEIESNAFDYLGDQVDERQLRELAAAMADEELAAHVAAQMNWPEVTDCDRLDAAFAELEHSGIVARHDFTCCNSCGNAEISAELGPGTRGYAFYHQQDSEAAAEGMRLFIGYGAVDDDGDVVAIGREIAAALTRNGLSTNWHGDPSRRVDVSINWQRRRDVVPSR